ncbi:MAG: EutN/CcmL family microcompartment protein [Pirellulales bacterium]|jgi:ethanolamine utilization protein EutN
MQLAKVIGSATATVKHQSMVGWKLMLINVLSADGETPDGDPVLAIDALGTGVGQRVMISSDGRRTRELLGDNTTPVRWTILGICD